MEYIDLLKNEVKKVFGRRILSSTDCENLSDDILRKSRVKISCNTIRRFFNLLKAKNAPSVYTLNALANYCGFFSFDNFVVSRMQTMATEPHEQEKILLGFLTLFFKQIEVVKRNDSTYLKLVQQLILHMEKYPAIIDRFQEEIAKTKIGQSFYYEQFVFIDKFNSYYGKGLQYYLNEKKTKESQLFAHSLLCYKEWLTGHREGVDKHYKKIKRYKVDRSVSSSVCARCFTAELLYTNIHGIDHENILANARRFYTSNRDLGENAYHLNCFEIILSEALILIAQYDEAMFYIRQILKKIKSNLSTHIDVALYENIYLFKAIVFANTGRKMKAYELLQDIDPYKFSFLSRQYLNILYLSAKQLIRNKNEDQEQIEHLIQETGFARLSFFCESNSGSLNNHISINSNR
jgi:hypothetical protein